MAPRTIFSPMRYSTLATLALALSVAVLAPTPGRAQETTPDTTMTEARAAERDWLFEALRTAPTETIGKAIADQIWRFWSSGAPDQDAAELLKLAIERSRWQDFNGALVHLDKLIARAPNWSEAWNQRATVYFHQEDYDRSLADVARTLTLEPKHFGALAGKAVIFMRQGRIELGQRALREALELHPWLKERAMLLPIQGQEL